MLIELNAEIKALYYFLFYSKQNIQTTEWEYLYNKLLDLNHSYLLELYRKGVLGILDSSKTLKKGNYKIKNVAHIIPAYYYDYVNKRGIFNSETDY